MKTPIILLLLSSFLAFSQIPCESKIRFVGNNAVMPDSCWDQFADEYEAFRAKSEQCDTAIAKADSLLKHERRVFEQSQSICADRIAQSNNNLVLARKKATKTKGILTGSIVVNVILIVLAVLK
jgi:hypothetical protein